MESHTSGFEFEYAPTTVNFGRGCIETIGDVIERNGCSNALIVCGSNVGANEDLMNPIEAGLGRSYGGTFAETSQAKYIGTALDGADRIREADVDALVSVGGGSSLDVAKAMALLGVENRSRDEILIEVEETGLVPTPPSDDAPLPLFVVPTTLAGADMTSSGGINLDTDPFRTVQAHEEVASAKSGDPRLMPTALFYDPDLFATTPRSILAASSMNGFDKAIETLYAADRNPISEAHALHGLKHASQGLPGLASAGADDEAIDRTVEGIILAQYGCRPNVIHAFGNGISSYYSVQQGVVHGIVAPPVLEYVFEQAPAGRELIAEGLGFDTGGLDDAELGEMVVEAVADIRDDLDLPAQLRTVEGLERDDFEAVAKVVADNFHFQYAPAPLKFDAEEIEALLQDAW